MKKIILILIMSAASLFGYSQKSLDSLLSEIKTEIQKDTIAGFKGEKYRFNPCTFQFNYNLKSGEIQLTRLKIPEPDFTDMSQEKEVRTVKLKLLDPSAISVDSTQYGCSMKIKTLSQNKAVEFKFINGGNENSIMNDFLNLGNYSRAGSKQHLQHIADLFKEAIILAQKK